MSKKRQRERPAVDTQLVEIYEDLANIDESIRLKAAHTLLSNFVIGSKATGIRLNEILRRLIRGLCSGRKAARLGFSIALTELLTALLGRDAPIKEGFPSVSGIVDTLKAQTHITESADSQEIRDHRIGRLFGAEAIIKSGILFLCSEEPDPWTDILDGILDLADKKSWLREQCGFVLYNSLAIIQKQEAGSFYAQSMIEKIHSSKLSKTPEGVAVWISVNSKYPSTIFPDGVWRHNDPLDRKEKFKLATILKEATSSESDKDDIEAKPSQKGSWNANVHFAWRVVLSELAGKMIGQTGSRSKRLSFGEFWDDCVDKSLFGANASKERKFWGFLLFQQVVSEAKVPADILALISPNLMRCLVNHLASQDRYLHRAAEKARKILLDRCKEDSSIAAMMIVTLFQKGYLDFDIISKTKTIEQLLIGLDAPSVDSVLQQYNNIILNPGTNDEKQAAAKRLLVADQLVSLVRSMVLEGDAETQSSKAVLRSVIGLLAKHAYLETAIQTPLATVSITSASREVFKARLSSCLSHAVAKTSDAPSICCELIHDLRNAVSGGPDADKPLLEADPIVQRTLDSSWDNIQRITKSSASNGRGVLRSANLLLSLAYLQVLNGDADAINILEELNVCFDEERIKRCDENENHTSSVVVEVLLSFVAKPSQLYRRLAQQVFDSFASGLDENGLRSMLNILKTQENTAGQADVFEQEPEDDGIEVDNEIDSSSIDEIVSDVDMIEANSDGPSVDDDSQTSEVPDEPDEELAAFDAKLAQALKTRPGLDDLKHADSGSSTDEDMDDEQMAALDGHLEQVFRERRKVVSKKTEKKDAKETIINFKCRVLELLEIFVKRQHSNILALEILLPLLTLLRTTSSPLVSNRAAGLVREYSRLCKGKEIPQIASADKLFILLEAVHVEATKDGSNAYGSACSQASLLLVRILAADDRQHLLRVIKVYASTQERVLFDPKCKVKMSILTDWLNWISSARR